MKRLKKIKFKKFHKKTGSWQILKIRKRKKKKKKEGVYYPQLEKKNYR